MEITTNDIEILRNLASRYMEIASLPVQKEKLALWKALNRGCMQRPMVVIEQLPWHELNGGGDLTCRVENPVWQEVERDMRQTIYKWEHFPVDMVVEPFITIPKSIASTGYGIDVTESTIAVDNKSDVVSHVYHNQIIREEDISKIKDMVITHNVSESRLWMQQGEVIFQGIAPVRQSGGLQFNLSIWDMLATWMGVENIYFDLIDRPDFIHAALERITSATLSGIRQANELGIHDDTINTCHCRCIYIYTDSLLPDFNSGKGPFSKNCWSFGTAQLFSSVSPAITAEFEIPYISKLAEPFGMIYYGCCDRLDDRLDLVKKIPNVKKVSCSPWSDRDAFAEKIGPSLVMSNKPTPAFLAMETQDAEIIRKDLAHTVMAARKNQVNLELILKDISTVKYQPERLSEWARIAMDVVS